MMNDEDAITILEIAGYAIETLPEVLGSHLDISDEELERLYHLTGEQQFEIHHALDNS